MKVAKFLLKLAFGAFLTFMLYHSFRVILFFCGVLYGQYLDTSYTNAIYVLVAVGLMVFTIFMPLLPFILRVRYAYILSILPFTLMIKFKYEFDRSTLEFDSVSMYGNSFGYGADGLLNNSSYINLSIPVGALLCLVGVLYFSKNRRTTNGRQ